MPQCSFSLYLLTNQRHLLCFASPQWFQKTVSIHKTPELFQATLNFPLRIFTKPHVRLWWCYRRGKLWRLLGKNNWRDHSSVINLSLESWWEDCPKRRGLMKLHHASATSPNWNSKTLLMLQTCVFIATSRWWVMTSHIFHNFSRSACTGLWWHIISNLN